MLRKGQLNQKRTIRGGSRGGYNICLRKEDIFGVFSSKVNFFQYDILTIGLYTSFQAAQVQTEGEGAIS